MWVEKPIVGSKSEPHAEVKYLWAMDSGQRHLKRANRAQDHRQSWDDDN